jgi:hypothetical protein
MQLFKLPLEDVGVGGCELGFAEAADGVEHVQRPAPFFGFDFAERLHALESLAHFAFRQGRAFSNNGNPSFDGNTIQSKIAANPTGTARRGRKRLSAVASAVAALWRDKLLRRDRALDDKLSCRAVVPCRAEV